MPQQRKLKCMYIASIKRSMLATGNNPNPRPLTFPDRGLRSGGQVLVEDRPFEQKGEGEGKRRCLLTALAPCKSRFGTKPEPQTLRFGLEP